MDLYPDLRQLGGLGPAVDAELSARGSPLRVRPVVTDTVPFAYAYVAKGGRTSNVTIAKNERKFHAAVWCEGVQYASGWNLVLPEVVRAIDLFVGGGVSYAILREECPWLTLAAAVAHEAGAATYVCESWTVLLSWLASEKPSSAMSPLVPLARAAHDHPVLRTLLPFTSMSWLCFSRCTGYPLDIVGLCAAPDGQGGFLLGRRDAPTAAANVEEAIAMIVSSMPAGCPPAGHGTSDSL